MIKINNLHVSVEGKEILRGIDMAIKPGEVTAIMGKNGSGKSTLAFTLMGHPKYKITEGEIEVDKTKINDLAPNERAELGIFLANQYPAAVPGLGSTSFLWQIYKKRNKNKTNIIEFREWIETQAKALDLNLDLLKRGLNDGFSGGEKKKMEILQLLVSNPKYVILDEIDSGLDVDALKKIALTVAKVAKVKKIGVIIITHYSRILKYIKVDRVHVMEAGLVKESGDSSLVDRIENTGFENK